MCRCRIAIACCSSVRGRWAAGSWCAPCCPSCMPEHMTPPFEIVCLLAARRETEAPPPLRSWLWRATAASCNALWALLILPVTASSALLHWLGILKHSDNKPRSWVEREVRGRGTRQAGSQPGAGRATTTTTTLPGSFLVPDCQSRERRNPQSQPTKQPTNRPTTHSQDTMAVTAPFWNAVVKSLRGRDLLNDREVRVPVPACGCACLCVATHALHMSGGGRGKRALCCSCEAHLPPPALHRAPPYPPPPPPHPAPPPRFCCPGVCPVLHGCLAQPRGHDGHLEAHGHDHDGHGPLQQRRQRRRCRVGAAPRDLPAARRRLRRWVVGPP